MKRLRDNAALGMDAFGAPWSSRAAVHRVFGYRFTIAGIRFRGFAFAVIGACLLMLHATIIAAQTASPPIDTLAIQEAKKHYDHGQFLIKEDSWAPALAEFLESRRIYPMWSATSSAARCLQHLKRHDEALDMYEALIRDFHGKLPANVQQLAEQEIQKLQQFVGTIQFEGAEDGTLFVVDSSRHGEIPAVSAVRVTADTHTIRLYKEGFVPLKITVNVKANAITTVVAKLKKP